MNVLNQMKKRNFKPGVIIYTNLLQVCFNMRRIDRAVLLFEKMQQENIQRKNKYINFLVIIFIY